MSIGLLTPVSSGAVITLSRRDNSQSGDYPSKFRELEDRLRLPRGSSPRHGPAATSLSSWAAPFSGSMQAQTKINDSQNDCFPSNRRLENPLPAHLHPHGSINVNKMISGRCASVMYGLSRWLLLQRQIPQLLTKILRPVETPNRKSIILSDTDP